MCSACSSVLCACCAIGSNTTNPPRVTSGRKRSVFLLFVSICLSLLYQYWLSDFILDTDQLVSTNKVLSTNYLHDTWINGCEHYANKNNDNDDNILLKRCVSINGNFRVSAMTTLFFIVAFLICLLVRPTFNRELWSVKLILYFLAVLVTIAIPNEPYFMNVYLNIARGMFVLCMHLCKCVCMYMYFGIVYSILVEKEFTFPYCIVHFHYLCCIIF